MATAKDIVAHMIAGKCICTACTTANATAIPEDSEITRWDCETSDVCDMCHRPLHADAKVYVIGSNMPGYMPDSEPFTVVGTFDEAKRALIDELKFAEDYANNEEEAEEYCHAAEDLNLWSGPDSIHVANLVYWITEQ